MRFLVVFLLVLSTPAWAVCAGDDVVANGATLTARSADGRPLITMEAVGGVTVRHNGDGSGGFTLARECDPVYAAKLRSQLERMLRRENIAAR